MHNVALNKTQSSAWTHKVAQTQQGSRRSLFVFPPCSLFGFTEAEKLQRLRDVVTPVSQWYGKVDKAITLSLQNIDFDASQPRKLAEGRFYYRPRWAERRQIELSPDRSHHSLSRLSRRHDNPIHSIKNWFWAWVSVCAQNISNIIRFFLYSLSLIVIPDIFLKITSPPASIEEKCSCSVVKKTKDLFFLSIIYYLRSALTR